jgi:carbon storage regulator
MLVLTRKTGQRIRIGEDITLVITEINGDSVRVGFDAPKSVVILREEIYERVHYDPAQCDLGDPVG